jgi:hypothetical protein
MRLEFFLFHLIVKFHISFPSGAAGHPVPEQEVIEAPLPEWRRLVKFVQCKQLMAAERGILYGKKRLHCAFVRNTFLFLPFFYIKCFSLRYKIPRFVANRYLFKLTLRGDSARERESRCIDLWTHRLISSLISKSACVIQWTKP